MCFSDVKKNSKMCYAILKSRYTGYIYITEQDVHQLKRSYKSRDITKASISIVQRVMNAPRLV